MLLLLTPAKAAVRAEVLASLQGDLDVDTVGALRNQVFPLLDPVPERLVLDLSKVSSVGPAGIRTLVALRRKCASAGVRFVLRSPSMSVRHELQSGRVQRFFEIEG